MNLASFDKTYSSFRQADKIIIKCDHPDHLGDRTRSLGKGPTRRNILKNSRERFICPECTMSFDNSMNKIGQGRNQFMMMYKLQKYMGSNWIIYHRYQDLDQANKALVFNSNMARMIWPMRIIDDNGNIIRHYEPEDDMRWPGPRERTTQRIAYSLWEQANCPKGDGTEFWHKSEQLLPTNNGLSELKIS